MAWFTRKKKGDTSAASTEEKSVEPIKVPTGGNADAYRMIIGPHITEKVSGGYAFRVAMDATTVGIKRAIQSLYGVSVINVRTVRLPSKKRRIGKFEGTKAGFKKAIVTLKQGDTIQHA